MPHLDDEEKASLLASIPPYQRDARSKGVPQLGAGAIYPVPEDDILIPDFEIPVHWWRGYGMDVGWKFTAAVWVAYDPQSKTRYIYTTHKRGEAEPIVHAEAIRGRGEWIPGRIDPAANGRGQRDGSQLLKVYTTELGLKLEMAPNGIEAGIYDVWRLLSTGRLKVFKSCSQWIEEFRLYRRNEKGQIHKEDDHLMDATRYVVASGTEWMRNAPAEKPIVHQPAYSNQGLGWLGG